MEPSSPSPSKPDIEGNFPVQDNSTVNPEDLEKITLLQKLNLAHEVALDQKFTLKKQEPPPNSIEKVVADCFASAFWDIFREQISEDPPNLTMALDLLREIKEFLFNLMMPHQVKLKNEIDVTLDLELMKQQALHGALDVPYFTQYILSIMKKLCAPIRDEKISELMKETDLVSLFRGILDTLKLMNIDMANFTLFSIRPELVSNNMEYERQKFADYVKLSGDNLPVTEAWLKKHFEPGVNESIKSVLYEAFLDLLTWDSNEPYPETLILDEGRLVKLKEEFYTVTMMATIVLLSFNSIPPALLSDTKLKEDIKHHVHLLLDGINSDEKLAQKIQNVVDQLRKDINDKLIARKMEPLSDAQVESLQKQIEPVIDPNNRVRSLVNLRAKDYFKLTLQHPSNKTVFPPALVLFKNEFEALRISFMNVVLYNTNICFEHYKRIFNDGTSPSPSSSA